MIPEATQDVEVGQDLGLRLRPGARYPAGQRCLRGRSRGQLAPDDLAGTADLDENPGGVGGQVQRYRLAGLVRGVDRVSDEFGNQQFGALGQGVQPPLPQDMLDVQAGARHRGGQGAEFERTAERPRIRCHMPSMH